MLLEKIFYAAAMTPRGIRLILKNNALENLFVEFKNLSKLWSAFAYNQHLVVLIESLLPARLLHENMLKTHVSERFRTDDGISLSTTQSSKLALLPVRGGSF